MQYNKPQNVTASINWRNLQVQKYRYYIFLAIEKTNTQIFIF